MRYLVKRKYIFFEIFFRKGYIMFTNRLNQLLVDKQITAYKVAKSTGISQGLMNEYKNGVKFPTIQNLIKIADYLGCSVDYLLGRTNNPEVNR